MRIKTFKLYCIAVQYLIFSLVFFSIRNIIILYYTRNHGILFIFNIIYTFTRVRVNLLIYYIIVIIRNCLATNVNAHFS